MQIQSLNCPPTAQCQSSATECNVLRMTRGLCVDRARHYRVYCARTHVICHNSHSHYTENARQEAAQRPPLFHFAISRDPRVQFNVFELILGFLLSTFHERAGHVYVRLADSATSSKHVVYRTSKFSEPSKPTGRDKRELTNKISTYLRFI